MRGLQEELRTYAHTMGQVGMMDIAALAATRTEDGRVVKVDGSAPISAPRLKKQEAGELSAATRADSGAIPQQDKSGDQHSLVIFHFFCSCV